MQRLRRVLCTMLAISLTVASSVNAQIISTFAGTGVLGNTGNGGLATSATFNTPRDVAIDAAGNKYIADQGSNTVRKVDPAGVITAFAGNGSAGISGDGGPAVNAAVGEPYSVVCDAAGNVYIAQIGGVIRKVDLSGNISTYAGTGTNGFSGDGGPATAAQFNWPLLYMAIDGAGNIYVADRTNNRVRMINTAGTITTFAGNGTAASTGDGGLATAASLNGPCGVGVDNAGNVYIAEQFGTRVRKVSPGGIISTLATGIAAFDIVPTGTGDIYVLGLTNPIVYVMDQLGNFSNFAGNGSTGYTGDGGLATSATLNAPSGGTIDNSGNLYIAEYGNHVVRLVTVPNSSAALNFDGTDDYVDIPSQLVNLATAPFTMEAWINTTATNVSIIGCDNGGSGWQLGERGFYLDGMGRPALQGNWSGYIFSTVPVNDGNWHHVAVTFDYAAQRRNIYVDGVNTTDVGGSDYSGFSATSGTFKIGRSDLTANFSGTMDEIRIWDRELCQGELQNNMSCEFSGSQSGLVAYYKANQGIAGGTNTGLDSLVDDSGNSNLGTLTNFALTGTTSNWVTGHVSGSCSVYSATPTVTAGGPTTVCSGDTVVLTSSAADSYQWQLNGSDISGATSQSYAATATGNYSVNIVTLGCSGSSTATSVTVQPAITLTASQTDETPCNNSDNGTATVSASGGGGSFTYAWSPSGGTAATATGLTAGNYTVTVTDANSCTATQTYTITEPTPIVGTPSQMNVSCNGGNNGNATVVASGGGSPFYSYLWAPTGGTGTTEFGLTAGNYTVTISNVLGCSGTQTFTITQPAAITIAASQTNILCNGGNTGSATATVSGGTAPYSYSWAPSGGTGSTASNLTAGVYTVTVTDFNFCTNTQTYNITQPTALATTGSQTNVSCNGGSNGSATVSVSGGTTPYSYSWAPSGGTGTTASGLTSGNYTVTVTDANSCTTTRTYNITQPSALTASQGSITNVSCNGGNNGSATVSVSGGTSPYTYSWSPSGGTAATATGLTAGNYTVTVTDNNLCTTTQTFAITEPTPVVITPSQTNVSCNGGANGTATATVSGGGSTFFSYSWAPTGGTGSTATGLTAGNYTVTVTSSLGCVATQTYTITQPTALTLVPSQTNVLCNGGASGTATATVSGGAGFYTYAWAPTGGTGSTASGLTAGTYTVLVTDFNFCTITQTYTITQPATITSTGSQTNVSCFGGSNGTATVVPAGGTSPYTYVWSPNGGVGSTGTGLSAGNYTVTITDANNCTATRTYTITQPASALTASQGTITNVSCNGGSNGSATVTAAGGTSPYTYSWAPTGGTGSTGTGLSAGVYTATVTDANGCTATQTFSITEPTVITTTASQSNVSCNGGSNGTASVMALGGTGAYTYSWAPTGGTAATATGLSAGNYTVTVTDANSCTATQTYTITEPTLLVASPGSQTNVSCNGGSNGSATVSVAGGTPSYSYSWAPSGGTAATATSLSAGNYTVTVTDANSCTTTQTFAITEPALLVASASSQTNVSCNGGSNGSATVSATGGTGAYTYSWAPTGGTAATATGLAAGTYTATVTDANLCTATQTFTITEPTAITSSGSQTNVLCNGGSTGTATVVASGGTPGYTYSWAPTGGTASTATGLAAGNYTVTITDANTCTATHTFAITEPTVLVASPASQTNVGCNGGSNGSATVSVTGGTPVYSYSWAPSGGTAATATGLSVGIYTVTVTDANSCTTTQTFNITQPTAMSSTTTQTNLTCNGGSDGTASISVSGGTPGYTYSWAPTGGTGSTATGLTAGNYTVTVTDANSCTHTRTYNITQPTAITATASQTNVSCNGGSNGTATIVASGGSSPFYSYSWAPYGGTGTTASGLVAGNYTVTITNSLGCTGSQTFTITEPTTLVASAVSQTNISCNGGFNGAATVSATGGTTPYSYSWAPTGGTAATATGLAAGTYTATVTDANGCTASQTFTLTQPTALTTTGTQTNVSCNGGTNGSASVTASGGTGAYTYSWAPTGGTASTATGLAAGIYTVTVTDANACTTTRTYAITQPAALATTGSQSNVLCSGGTSGSATVSVTGGTTPYTYSWAPSGGTAATATGLAAGNYTVTVTDANSCVITRTYTITQPSAIVTTGTQTNVSCNGGTNGSATVVATGGTGAFTYSWAPSGGTAATATGLASGIYTVTVTDANLCTATRTFNITQPAVLATTGTQVNVSCNGLNNATATVTASGGTAPYAYSWAPTGGTASTATNLAPGTYTVTVTDINSCTTTRTYNITQPAVLAATGTSTNVACFGAATGTATVTPTGGTTPYSYSWAPSGGTAATATGLVAGTYTVTVTDFNGCTTTQSYTITQPTQLATTGTQTNVSCNSGSDGTATVSVTGGVSPYSYSWAPIGGTAATATNLPSNVYTVTVTDANSCVTTRTYNITQPTYLSTTGTQVNVSCNGANDASATVVASGGTPGYTYSWAPTGGTGTTESNLSPGVYTVTVTDANGCIATRTYNITQPAVLATTASQVDVLCNGNSTGSATIIATGGTMPYAYIWSNGGTAATETGLSAGIYTATVTDANGCSSSQTYTITEPTVLVNTPSQTNPLCNGDANGTLTATISGGAAPYTYSWSSGGTAATETGLSSGTYTVTVTDDNGCVLTDNYTLVDPAVLVAMPSSSTPGCTGNSLSLFDNSTGGTMPYSYAWTGPNSYTSPAQNPVISNITLAEAGTYYVTVTDANGCMAMDSTTVVVNESPAVVTHPQPVTACFGTSASFSVAATGTAITYQWRANGVSLTNTGVYSGVNTPTLNISNVTGLSGTLYDVVVSGTTCVPATSNTALLTAPSFNTWGGGVDTAWSNVNNWQCGIVPTITTDVIIPGNAPRMPLIDIPNATANSITINSGASLAFVGTNSQVEIKADITNLGTFNAANGAVMLTGLGLQTIPGGTYREIEVSGANVKTATGNLAVTGNLILTSGYLQLNGNNLTLTSTAGVVGGDAGSFVITNGSGVVIAQGLGNGGVMVPVTFPVGAVAGIYTPATIFNGGTVDNFSVRVINGVYSDYNNETPIGFPLTANSVNKTWFIKEAVAGGSNAQVSLSWPLSEELTGFNNSLCDVSHYISDSSNWSSGPVGQATGTTTLFTQVRPNVTSFSPFGLGTQNNPLGMDAVQLAGVYNIGRKEVDLSWARSSDNDVYKYSVERSIDGASFTAIGARDAGEDTYTLSDADATKQGVKQLYYRVQVVSVDGYAYSNTIKVDLESMLVTYGMTLYPNPVTGNQMFISLTNNSLATNMDVAIMDMTGKEVKKYHYEAGTYNPGAIAVDVAELAQGIYTIKVKQAGTSLQTAKFTKK